MRHRRLEPQAFDEALGSWAPDRFPNNPFLQRRPPMQYFRHIGWKVRSPRRVRCGIDAMAAQMDAHALSD